MADIDPCPICKGALEEIDVAPCYDCGHEPAELEELSRREHEYFVYSAFGQEIVLCDFCDVDFGSYDPNYFGWPKRRPDDGLLERVRAIDDPRPARDGYCSHCRHRKAFLSFLKAARKYNNAKLHEAKNAR